MTYRLFLFFILALYLVISVTAQDEEPKNILNLPAFGFLTYPETWVPLWDHPYAPAVQSEDGTITVRLQSGETLESPLTVDSAGTDPLKVLQSLNLDMLGEPTEIHFGNEENIPLEGVIVETKLDKDNNRLVVLALPTYQEYWYLITLDGPASDWEAVLPLAENILETFLYIPNAPILRVVLGYDLPEGAVLRRHELAALEVISQRLHGLDLGTTPFTVHLLSDQTVEIGFYGGIREVAEVAAWVTQVGFLELVDFSDVESPESFLDTTILTTGRLDWDAANQPAAAPSAETDADAQLHPTTKAPFETVITSTDFTDAVATMSSMTLQWEFEGHIAEAAQGTLKTFTQEQVGKAMAIVLDGQVLLMPRIQSELSESLVLSGQFSEEEIRRLAAVVNSGPLPVPMVVETIELLE